MDYGKLCCVLREKGIRIRPRKVLKGKQKVAVEPVELVIDAPKGRVTPDLREKIVANKAAFLQHGFWWEQANGRGVERHWWGFCAGCGCLLQGGGEGFPVPARGVSVCVWCVGKMKKEGYQVVPARF